jgi:hypothetical protein
MKGVIDMSKKKRPFGHFTPSEARLIVTNQGSRAFFSKFDNG